MKTSFKTWFKYYFWYLTHPSDWLIFYKIKYFIWKIKDYDRLQYDYSCVLCHATGNRMSYTTYELNDIYSEIDDAQYHYWHDTFKEDLLEMINKGATIEEIKEYYSNNNIDTEN
jgi:hypothetical protein